jgi:hypothetical protein
MAQDSELSLTRQPRIARKIVNKITIDNMLVMRQYKQ